MLDFSNHETALIIVDHGSRRLESNQMLEEIVQGFLEISPFSVVEAAHMELAEPSIRTAFDRCVERGARLIIVFPYFLLPGRHWKHDIPRLTREAAARHSDVHFLVTAPIGKHSLISKIVLSRVQQCLEQALQKGPACDVCIAQGASCLVESSEDGPQSQHGVDET